MIPKIIFHCNEYIELEPLFDLKDTDKKIWFNAKHGMVTPAEYDRLLKEQIEKIQPVKI